jgi:hypothetical protein
MCSILLWWWSLLSTVKMKQCFGDMRSLFVWWTCSLLYTWTPEWWMAWNVWGNVLCHCHMLSSPNGKNCWSMITPNMSKHTCYFMTLHCNSREAATANDCMVCHHSLCTVSSFWTSTQKLLLHICVCQIVTSLNYGCKSKQVATNHQRHKQANNKMQTIKQANKQATAQHTNQPTLNNHSQWCNTANKPPNK